MSVQVRSNEINETKKRLFRLLVEVQFELSVLRKSRSYDQDLGSDLQQIELNLDCLMERILNDS